MASIHSFNPYQSDEAILNSCSIMPHPDFPERPLLASSGERVLEKKALHIHSLFRSTISSPAFPCVVGKAVMARNSYRLGLYRNAGNADCIEGLCRDLFSFVIDQQSMPFEFSSFIATFELPKIRSEKEFEKTLWSILQQLNIRDADHFSWNSENSTDPASDGFAFSFAGRSFFVVGLHSFSSRISRTFPYPTLVFNSHEQFIRLQNSDRFKKLQSVIRQADIELQGDINPSLNSLEAAQFSGRHVGKRWKCPFKAAIAAMPLFKWTFEDDDERT